MAQTRVNRRGFLAAAGLIGVSAALAACSSSGGERRARSAAAGAPPAAPRRRPRPAPPAAGRRRSRTSSSCTTGPTTSTPATSRPFKAEYGRRRSSSTTSSPTTRSCSRSSRAAASGYDIAAPTAEYVPAMVEEGFLQKLDLVADPERQVHRPGTFKNQWWDPTNEYQVPKDYGTTGILYRSQARHGADHVVEGVLRPRRRASTRGKIVFVDSMGDVLVFPLKMLGYSLNSVETGGARRGAEDPARRRAAPPRARLGHVRTR